MKNKGLLVILFISILALIISSCNGGGGKSALVTDITVTSEDAQETVVIDQTLQMIAQLQPENASNKAVVWSVENAAGDSARENRAEITQAGLLTGLSEGTVIVKATAKDGSEVEETKEITVTAPQPGMVTINAGTFQMGNTRDDIEGESDEKPVHEVKLTYDYEIGKYEVTFEEYDAYCEATGKSKPDDEGWGRGSRPVINVSWYEAIKYCNWLSEQEGLAKAYDNSGNLLNTVGQVTTDITQVEGYRLPTEAEWEYAARGGHKDITNGLEANDYKYAGSDNVNSVAWYSNWISDRNTHIVGQRQPNELGLYDMSGNVWEWCHEWYGEYPSTTQTNPIGSETDCNRVLRSGSWGNPDWRSRVSERYRGKPSDARHAILGFRIVRTTD